MNGPVLATDPQANLHALWVTGGEVAGSPAVRDVPISGYKILYRRMSNDAVPSSEPVYVSNGVHPRLAVAGDGVAHLVWESRDSLTFARIDPSGVRAIPLSPTGVFPSLAIALNRDEAYVAWHERNSNDELQIRFARLTFRAVAP